MITTREEFIKDLFNFLKSTNTDKLKYILTNIDALYQASASGENRSWSGINSNGKVNFYHEQLDNEQKTILNKYIANMLSNPRYKFIRDKYKLN